MRIASHLLLLLLIALPGVSQPATPSPFTPEQGSQIEKKRNVRWAITPDPSLPNVLVLGDSISIGYTLPLRQLLQGKANVFRPVTPDGSGPVNCEGTTAGMKHLDQWLEGRKWAVIHCNWGLHDLKHVKSPGQGANSNQAGDPRQASLEEYGRNLTAIVDKLKATGARIVFATTTPVSPGTTNPLREPDAPPRYNAEAEKIMTTNGIRINDLYALCEPRLKEIQQPHNVHFTDGGYRILAAQVATVIREELAAMDSHTNRNTD